MIFSTSSNSFPMRNLAGSILKNADRIILPSAHIAEMRKRFIVIKMERSLSAHTVKSSLR